MSIYSLTKPRTSGQMLVKASSPFVYQCLDNVEINKCAKFDQNIPCCSRVMSVFTYHYRPNGCSAKPRPHFAYQLLQNVKMYKYAELDPTIPRDSRVMSVFTK